MDTQSTTPALPEDLVKLTEGERLSGLSRRTLLDNIHAGLLPAYRVGRKLLMVSRADLAALVRPVVAEDPDAAFIAEVVAAAGELTAEVRSEIRRLLPAPSAGGQR